jgi:hypothetical protein
MKNQEMAPQNSRLPEFLYVTLCPLWLEVLDLPLCFIIAFRSEGTFGLRRLA